MLRRLHSFPVTRHDDLLVGIESRDDAGVYRLGPDLALVQSVDYVTPVVDDPADWGAIGAANALSDIYAMGATPLTALQIVGWPRETLPLELLEEVLAGAAAVLEEAGVTLVGGHSIDDPEPKFGLAVTGIVAPGDEVRNRGGAPDDVLVLTKPLGTGVIATALKHGAAPEDSVLAAVASMRTLNRAAAEAMRRVGVSAATDVTGYGLLGHLAEMLGDGVGAEVEATAVPLLPHVRRLIDEKHVAGGSRRNLVQAAGYTDFGAADDITMTLLADAQTSGGLLIAVPPGRADELVAALAAAGVATRAVVGVMTTASGRIRVR